MVGGSLAIAKEFERRSEETMEMETEALAYVRCIGLYEAMVTSKAVDLTAGHAGWDAEPRFRALMALKRPQTATLAALRRRLSLHVKVMNEPSCEPSAWRRSGAGCRTVR